MTTQNQNIRKILIAPDKFKGSLTSAQAAQAIKQGIEERYLLPDNPLHLGNAEGGFCAEGGDSTVSPLQFRIVEIADGGDGSLEVLQKKISGAAIADITVHDPLGREVPSQILLYRTPRAEKEADSRPEGERLCAFIEMAKVSGLEMLAKEERNPLHTSTYGMGEAIKEAISRGATQITLSIGGSATNDGGSGMLQALGYRFFDTAGNDIAAPICGENLQRVAKVEAPEGCNADVLSGIEFKVICDVTNPLLGELGATAVYGPQKGADKGALLMLEAGLSNYAAVAERCLGVSQGMKLYPGAGAAGGVGYAGLAFLGAELVPGWKFFAQITSLEESVQWADLVITGEGSLDSQSLSGKVVSGVINLAAKYDKEVAIFCGVSKLSPSDMNDVAEMLPKGINCYSIASLGYPLEVCMRDAALLLEQLARENVALK